MNSSALLFFSEYSQPCDDLLKDFEHFRTDLVISLVNVDVDTKKVQGLIEAYGVVGVPTLIVDNEKYAEGLAVNRALLPTHTGSETRCPNPSPGASALPPPRRAPLALQGAGDPDGENMLGVDDIVDHAIDTSMSDDKNPAGLEQRLQQLQQMRKESDDRCTSNNNRLYDSQVASSRVQALDED